MVQFNGTHMAVNGVQARIGKHGTLHIQGSLPLLPPNAIAASGNSDGRRSDGEDEGLTLSLQVKCACDGRFLKYEAWLLFD